MFWSLYLLHDDVICEVSIIKMFIRYPIVIVLHAETKLNRYFPSF